jgi:hypothetical protein
LAVDEEDRHLIATATGTIRRHVRHWSKAKTGEGQVVLLSSEPGTQWRIRPHCPDREDNPRQLLVD